MSICSPEALQYNPSKDGWIDRLIFTMFQFFEDPDHLVFEEFLQAYYITRQEFEGWRDTHPKLREAQQQVMIFVGARRRKGVMQFKLNGQSAFRDMHLLDPEWGPKVDKYHAEIKNMESQDNTPPKTLYIPASERTQEMDEFMAKKKEQQGEK